MKYDFKHKFIPKEKKLYSGMDAFLNTLSGRVKSKLKDKKKLYEKATLIHEYSLQLASLSDDELDEKVQYFFSLYQLGKVDEKKFIESFAIAVEIGFRELGKRAYEVQIMGALCLVNGYIIEMATGEGKTITAALAGVILGWSKKSVHIITSNDYLASRDAELVRAFYERASLTIESITSQTDKEQREEFYKSNIVYSTAKEILADFLKDRIQDEKGEFNINSYLLSKLLKKKSRNRYLIKSLSAVIVDEADSVLADDAVTPLIISTTASNKLLQESVQIAYEIAQNLKKDIHYKVYEKYYEVILSDQGKRAVEKNTKKFSNIWNSAKKREYLVQQALVARELYHKNRHYIIQDDKIVIIDEKTGRRMEHRSWGNGLHQAIEVKEKITITDPTTTFAKMSFQRFFRLYSHLCGMSGTLENLKQEFWQIYEKYIITIPKRIPSKMVISPDKIFLNKKQKFVALMEYVRDLHKKGLPILIGVTTIKESQELAHLLKTVNINCTLLNALSDEQEAQIIAKAGEKGSITIATNMAGRGTDIHICDDVEKLGGLQVITIQRDKSRRVDLQFFGRCARQGKNGTAVSFLSLDDQILSYYTNPRIYKLLHKYFDHPFVKKLSLWIYIYYQKKIEKDISNLRNETLQKEFTTMDSMSYTS